MAASLSPWMQRAATLHRVVSSAHNQTLALRAASVIRQQLAHKSTSVLGRSTILLQDGLDIKELPLVIRRMSEAEFPFMHYSRDHTRRESEEEFAFHTKLQGCFTVQQVFRLLEVPGEHVTAYSAGFALQRICQLQKGSCSEIDTFISKAILHKLCSTATEGISSLTSHMLINMVECYLNLPSVDTMYIQPINIEVEKRIGDGVFNIEELCTLIEMLSLGIRGDSELVNSLWIHLGNRYKEFDENCIGHVYSVLRYITPEHKKYLLPLLDKCFKSCYGKLTADDMRKACNGLTLANSRSHNTFVDIGKWVVMNIHTLNDEDLVDIVALFRRFAITNVNLFRALERYVSAKIDTMDRDLIAIVMEYCKGRRLLSTKIHDAVARNIVSHGHEYTAHQLILSLRSFGYLNYLPPNEVQLFSKVEQVLLDRFSELEPYLALSLLTTFAYVGRYPMNFLTRLYTPHFMSKITDLKDYHAKKRSVRYLHQLKVAIHLEVSNASFPTRFHRNPPRFTTAKESNIQKLSKVGMGKTMSKLIGSDYFRTNVVPHRTPYVIDFLVYVDKDDKPMLVEEDMDFLGILDCEKRIAIMTFAMTHYCANMGSLLGEHAMKVRHLTKMGYTVIQLNVSSYSQDWTFILKRHLSRHVQLPKPAEQSAENQSQTSATALRSVGDMFVKDTAYTNEELFVKDTELCDKDTELCDKDIENVSDIDETQSDSSEELSDNPSDSDSER